jgi:hypothetical protein
MLCYMLGMWYEFVIPLAVLSKAPACGSNAIGAPLAVCACAVIVVCRTQAGTCGRNVSPCQQCALGKNAMCAPLLTVSCLAAYHCSKCSVI